MNNLRRLTESPETMSRSLPGFLQDRIREDLLDLRDGVISDQQFRKAPKTMQSWRFSYPLLTHEYFRSCMTEARFLRLDY